VVASGRFVFPPGLPVLLQVMAEAWLHGRTSPAFMAIPWEAEWHQPAEALRAKLGIKPFSSLIPADLVEQSRSAA
jgi:ubiquinone biosynthesis protein Coq4